MGNNLKEKLTFSVMMTFGMVLVMVSYNVIRAMGFNSTALLAIAMDLIPVFIVAFAVESLVVARNVKKLHKLFVAPNDSQLKYILIMSGMMATCMCVLMSLYATLVHYGTGSAFLVNYLQAIGRNLPVALGAQLIVVGPLVRFLHMQAFKTSRVQQGA